MRLRMTCQEYAGSCCLLHAKMTLHEKSGSIVVPAGNAAVALPGTSRISLPDQPIIKIRAGKSWSPINLKEIWVNRELLYFLIWRDLKARYKQTFLGVSWVILQPLLMTAVFTIFLGALVRVVTGSVPYPLFVYAGLLPWTYFSNAVSSGSYSLVASPNMITNVYLPRLIIPAAAVGVRLADFLVASLVLIVLMRYYGIPFGWRLLTVPALVLHLTLLALALSALFSALNVRYRDTGTALPVLLQLWMFASPIIYPAAYIPARWLWLYELNPLVGIIQAFRAAFFGNAFNQRSLLISALITLILFFWSTLIFRRMEDNFADVV